MESVVLDDDDLVGIYLGVFYWVCVVNRTV